MAWYNIDYVKYSPLGISLLTLFYTIIKDYRTNKRLKRVEQEQAREKQEEKLRRSRASAPFFCPSKIPISAVYESDGDGYFAWIVLKNNVLCSLRNEIDKSQQDTGKIILPLDTIGKMAKSVAVSGDIPDLEIKQETPGSNDLIFLKYTYCPANHGKSQKVNLDFETEDGYKLTHIYQTRHGFCEFKRIDPP